RRRLPRSAPAPRFYPGFSLQPEVLIPCRCLKAWALPHIYKNLPQLVQVVIASLREVSMTSEAGILKLQLPQISPSSFAIAVPSLEFSILANLDLYAAPSRSINAVNFSSFD